MKITTLVCLAVLSPAIASAAVTLTNGSFENIGALSLNALGGLNDPTGWTNLTGNQSVRFQASSALANNASNPEFTSAAGSATGPRYLRLAADPGGPAIWGALSQNLGTMVVGETYTLKADIFGGPGDGGQLYGAKVSFVNSESQTPGTTYATQTIDGVVNTAFTAAAFSISYTATATDNGQPLVVLLQALDNGASNQSRRGGLDNLQLTVVPEPSVSLLGGFAILVLVRRRRQ